MDPVYVAFNKPVRLDRSTQEDYVNMSYKPHLNAYSLAMSPKGDAVVVTLKRDGQQIIVPMANINSIKLPLTSGKGGPEGVVKK